MEQFIPECSFDISDLLFGLNPFKNPQNLLLIYFPLIILVGIFFKIKSKNAKLIYSIISGIIYLIWFWLIIFTPFKTC
jgi:hypothetical protein